MIACCGADCNACTLSEDCPGCSQIRGTPFWTKYVEISVCPVYNCCRNGRGFSSCVQCPEVPCTQYFAYPNPFINEEELKKELEKQMKNLKRNR